MLAGHVQIAPYGSIGKTRSSPKLREAQLRSMAAIPNASMVSTMDVGIDKYIHFIDKATPAQRLMYWALAKTYGVDGIGYCGPVLRRMTVDGAKAPLVRLG